MYEPLNDQKRKILRTLEQKRRGAFFILTAEKITETLWRPVCWTIFFLSLWLMQIPSIFGLVGHYLFFFTFIGGFFWFAYRDFKWPLFPTRRDIDRRMESANHLHHRPLTIADDKLANPEKVETRNLWGLQATYLEEAAQRLKVPPFRSRLAQKDSYALRYSVLLLLFSGFIIAGPHWKTRIGDGIMPFRVSGHPWIKDEHITLRIKPPEYTGINDYIFQASSKKLDKPLPIPAGSSIKVHVTGGISTPVLHMGETKAPFHALDKDHYQIEHTVLPGKEIEIRQFLRPRFTLPYKLAADTPPEITIEGDPETEKGGKIRFNLLVKDDYGVRDLTMHFNLIPEISDKPLGVPWEETRTVMSPAGIDTEVRPLYDTAWHPWAGMPVIVTFTITDLLGQSTQSEPIEMVLPERIFTHPVAKELVRIRHELLWNKEDAAMDAANALVPLLSHPEQYHGDIVVFLSLRSMISRLVYSSGSLDAIRHIIPQLWDTALRVEDGNLSLAARDLQQARQALENALQNPDVSDEELAALMDDLREAMASYMSEMFREMQKQMAEGIPSVNLPPEAFSNSVDLNELGSFFDQLQSEILSGDMEAAREMLSQLQKLSDQLSSSEIMEMPQDMQFMMKGVSEMQKLIEKQKELLEQTKEQTRQSDLSEPDYAPALPLDMGTLEQWQQALTMPPQPQDKPEALKPGPKTETDIEIDTQANKTEQDALRYILGQLMLEADEKLGEIPEEMGLAELEMRKSADQLGRNRPAQSIPHQEQTIEYLQKGMEQMNQQLMNRAGQMQIFSMGGMGGRLDPLGRPYGEDAGSGLFPGSKVKIPDEVERKRVQEILELLRKRSGERDRPRDELDYYNRLMRRF